MSFQFIGRFAASCWASATMAFAAFKFDWDPTLNPFGFEYSLKQFRAEFEGESDSAKKAMWQDSIDLYLAKTDSLQQLAIPLKFSALGFYSDMAAQTVTPEAHLYQVNSPQWSDGARKTRWIVLPPGGKVAFQPDADLFDYPDSTVMVQQFRLQKSATDTNSFPWETRLLVNHEEERNGQLEDIWYFFTYKWKKDGSDADLVSLNYGFDTTYFANDIPNTIDYVKWKFPDAGTCALCHRRDVVPSIEVGKNHSGRAVLGFFPAQLSRSTAGGNQITDLFAQGVFSGELPTSEQLSRRWMGVDEVLPTVDGENRSARDSVLNIMARSYVAANCSGCHGKRGVAVGAPFHTDDDYDFHELKFYPAGDLSAGREFKWYEDTTKMKFQDRILSWGYNIEGSALVRPGFPEKSIILVRQKSKNESLNRNQDPLQEISYSPSRDAMQMPPSGSYKVDERAIAVMEEWIRYMPDSTGEVDPDRVVAIHAPREAGVAIKSPTFLGRTLIVPEGWGGRVDILSVKGHRTELRRTHGSSYAIPDGVPNGIYLIRIGDRTFRRYLD